MGEIADLSALRPDAAFGAISPSQPKSTDEVLPKVFENVLLSATPVARPRSAPSLLLSLLLHGAAIAALFTLQFSNTLTVFPASSQHVTLIVPLLPPPLRIESPKPRIAVPRLAPPVVAPRRFEAPLAPPPPVTPKIALEPPPALAVVTPQPVVPAPVLQRTVTPPPPLKTDNLAEMRAATPAPVPKVPIQAAGFAGAESRTPNTPRGRVLTAGFSGVESSAAPAGSPRTVASNAGSVRQRRRGRGRFRPQWAGRKGRIRRHHGCCRHAPFPRGCIRCAGATQVEILSKPRPVYTDEGRRLQIEGEVLVELLFSAAGEARVLRMVRGLGHGLDENAIAAAQGIRFRPALSRGMPVDTTAIVHIVFQLAY